jgi:hypothetical protein
MSDMALPEKYANIEQPLSDVFSATQQGAPSPFRQARFERPVPSFRVAEDEPAQPVEEFVQAHRPSSSSTVNNDNPFQRKNVVHNFDSGFFGSQPEEATQPFTQPIEVPTYLATPPRPTSPMVDAVPDEMGAEQTLESDDEVEAVPTENAVVEPRESEARRTTGGSFQSAHEDQSKAEEGLAESEAAIEPETEVEPEAEREVEVVVEMEAEVEAESEPEAEPELAPDPEGEHTRSPEQETDHVMEDVAYPNLDSPLRNRSPAVQSPREKTPLKSTTPSPKKQRSPLKELPIEPQPSELTQDEDENMDDAPVAASPSEGSSPIRPIVRKSSLNFASLPAREPLTTKKSIGNRTSRTSHLDQNRTSYYGRLTGGKSLGNVKLDNAGGSDDEMDIDDGEKSTTQEDSEAETKLTRMHNKTSTQRLQDQISMLGQTQAITRPASKSLAGSGLGASQSTQATQPPTPQKVAEPSPQQTNATFVAPGAFPMDEEDSWIGPPPTTVTKDLSVFSPRPALQKTYTTEIMEDIHEKDTVGGFEFNMPKRGEEGRQRSPAREPAVLGHTKSVSTSFIQSASPKKAGEIASPLKPIAVSNPNPAVSTIDEELSSLPKSPTRTLRGSPLKAAKDKFSSILKSSRGLFASSAAVSAEAKTETLSPPSARIYRNPTPSLEDVLRSESNDEDEQSQAADTRSIDTYQSASKASIRKTRASTEREEKKKEEAAREAREAKEAKEAQKMTAQLEKARMKVKEEARVFHEEQERVTAMQKQMEARKEQDKLAKSSQVDVPRATRSSPRKTKAQLEAEAIAAVTQTAEASSSKDVDMTDVSSSMPPPAIPRPKSQIGRPGAKRPLRPTKETVSKAKPPTVIRVDTGSSRGQQYHPSNTTLAATLQESLQAPAASTSSQPAHMRNKASTSSLQSKTSTNSFKAAANKALEAAARKKEQDELAAQRKREAKLEIERQRTAAKEEERRQQEVARKRELERQRDLQKDGSTTAEVKRAPSRQAMDKRRLDMERAKETRAPPPAIRPQQHVDSWQDKALPPVPPQRNDLGGQTKISRINPPMNTAKAPPKRPLQQDNNDEQNSQSTMQRNGMSYLNETHHKRPRTNEYLDDEDELVESHPKMTAPPIRQSSIRPKVRKASVMPLLQLMLTYYRKWSPSHYSRVDTLTLHHLLIFKGQLLCLNISRNLGILWIWLRSPKVPSHSPRILDQMVSLTKHLPDLALLHM